MRRAQIRIEIGCPRIFLGVDLQRCCASVHSAAAPTERHSSTSVFSVAKKSAARCGQL